MGRRNRRIIGLAVLLAALALVGKRWIDARTPLLPLEVSLWYWRTPFQLPEAEISQLKTLGVRQLFVRAGTFVRSGDKVSLQIPQQWDSAAAGLDIHLVFNFDYAIVRDFGAFSNDALVPTIVAGVRKERDRASKVGLHIVGVQFDFDCPTRRLPKYADLLHRLRPALASAPTTLSITALPTWYTSRDIQAVSDAVDFIVPQYYEAVTPRTRSQYATISDMSRMTRGLAEVESHSTPFYVGVPAYGHALMYDDQGRLLGLYRDMDVLDANRHPSFRWQRTFASDTRGRQATPETYSGEQIVDYAAIRPARDGRGLGYHLFYDLPTPEIVAQHLALIRARRPRHCRGVILFRYPEPDATTTLPFASLAAALKGEPTRPRLQVRFKVTPAPWELIETGRRAQRAPLDLTITVTNVGNGSTRFAPDAVTLTLAFDRSGLESIELRHFDAADTYFSASPDPKTVPGDAALRASPARANVACFRKFHLAAGQSARIGPIRIPADGATQVRGFWTATGASGFDTEHDEIPSSSLLPTESTPR